MALWAKYVLGGPAGGSNQRHGPGTISTAQCPDPLGDEGHQLHSSQGAVRTPGRPLPEAGGRLAYAGGAKLARGSHCVSWRRWTVLYRARLSQIHTDDFERWLGPRPRKNFERRDCGL